MLSSGWGDSGNVRRRVILDPDVVPADGLEGPTHEERCDALDDPAAAALAVLVGTLDDGAGARSS